MTRPLAPWICLAPLLAGCPTAVPGDDDAVGDDDSPDDGPSIDPDAFGPPNAWWHARAADVPDGLEGGGWDVGDTAYDFTLVDQNGDQVELYQFYGKVVALDIFAQWCLPCRDGAPGGEAIWQELRDQGVVVLAAMQQNLVGGSPVSADARAWADELGLTHPVVADFAASQMGYLEPGFPTYVLLDRELRIAVDNLHEPSLDAARSLLSAGDDDDVLDDDGADDDDSAGGDPSGLSVPGWDPGVADLPCWAGEDCADSGPYLGTSCCAWGDSIEDLGPAPGSGVEFVDLEFDGTWAVACGGFGARIYRLLGPSTFEEIGSAGQRCQRAALGPDLPGGQKVVYVSHHGDSWIQTPSLTGVVADPAGSVGALFSEVEEGVLFEGLAYEDGVLYAAIHGGGLRVYGVDAGGLLSLETTVPGFTNAQKVAVSGSALYVADGAQLTVLDRSDPLAPVWVQSLPLSGGTSRDVAAGSGRVVVALGGGGVDLFDASAPLAPTFVQTVPVDGSAQAVSLEGDVLAVAAWADVQVFDLAVGERVGSEQVRPYPGFEQTLGVGMAGDLIAAAEWGGVRLLRYRPGYVAPDLQVDEDLFTFPRAVAGATTLRLKNRGALPLTVSSITAVSEVVASPSSLSLAPGATAAVTLSYTPPLSSPASGGAVSFLSDDPDAYQQPQRVPLHFPDSGSLDVGDTLGPEFGFLDPTGQGDVENLHGQVWVLAYFALF